MHEVLRVVTGEADIGQTERKEALRGGRLRAAYPQIVIQVPSCTMPHAVAAHECSSGVSQLTPVQCGTTHLKQREIEGVHPREDTMQCRLVGDWAAEEGLTSFQIRHREPIEPVRPMCAQVPLM
jgi:hypothetical protein